MHFSWQGASGAWYAFEVARAKRPWEAAPGLYMFVKPGDPALEAGGPVALYVAQTTSFAQSLARHEVWGVAQALGAAEIHLLAEADAGRRAFMEMDLVKAHTPLLNRRMLLKTA